MIIYSVCKLRKNIILGRCAERAASQWVMTHWMEGSLRGSFQLHALAHECLCGLIQLVQLVQSQLV